MNFAVLDVKVQSLRVQSLHRVNEDILFLLRLQRLNTLVHEGDTGLCFGKQK